MNQVLSMDPGPSFAHEIGDGLWIGNAPYIQSSHEANQTMTEIMKFDTLLLCAAEYQPHGDLFPVIEVVHAPLFDLFEPISKQQAKIAVEAARLVVCRLLEGKKVLVTCLAGRNRSGLVCALALCFGQWKMSAYDAVKLIRESRGPYALVNPYFVEFIKSLATDHLPSHMEAI